MASYDENGKLNAITLRNNFRAKGWEVDEGTDFPVKVTVDGFPFEIQANGTIGKSTGLKLSSSNLSIEENGNAQLVATLDANVTGEVNWEVSDEGVAVINPKKGNTITITAKGSIGSTTMITATVISKGEKLTETCRVEIIKKIPIPALWERANKEDHEKWYSYGGANTNEPIIVGGMTPIKFQGNLSNETNRWANAITADGSMFVWIPRFAYKIKSNYHESGTSTSGGEIDIAFVGTDNRFLNSKDGSGKASEDTTAPGAGTTSWLVHPAFTSNQKNGGWSTELSGIWVGKFEATGNYNDGEGTLSVLPGVSALCNMSINQQFRFAKEATFGETSADILNSHMAKNSEWGAIAYLGQSKYGTNNSQISNQLTLTTGSIDVGSITNAFKLYTTNATQSTTHNATGVYGMVGGAFENVASYVNYADNSALKYDGGESSGDLFESSTSESSQWKTAYEASGTEQLTNYELAKKIKGDGIYETSSECIGSTSWFGAGSEFPSSSCPFFSRGGYCYVESRGVFGYDAQDGWLAEYISFRVVLAP